MFIYIVSQVFLKMAVMNIQINLKDAENTSIDLNKLETSEELKKKKKRTTMTLKGYPQIKKGMTKTTTSLL